MKKSILTLAFTFFIYAIALSQNTWTQKTDFAGGQRYRGVAFTVGSKGYCGLGMDQFNSYYKDMWEYDPGNDTWTQKTDYPGGLRQFSSAFAIGNKGYVGCGENSSSVMQNDFWEFDPVGNSWSPKATVPGGGREDAAAAVCNGKGYIGFGFNGSTFLNDWYEYDVNANAWAARSAACPGGGRSGAVTGCVNNVIYFGTGYNGGQLDDFYSYDPQSDKWKTLTNVPGGLRGGASSFTIGQRIYVGTGGTTSYLNDLWEYDPQSGQWTSRAPIPRTGYAFTCGTAIMNKGYFFTGLPTSGSILVDTWKYDPPLVGNAYVTAEVTCAGGSNGSAYVIAGGGTPPYTYTWSPNGGNSATAINLSAGNYTCTIVDNVGATTTATLVITQPATSNNWAQVASIPVGRYTAANFTIGNKGYTVAGLASGYASDTWEYNAANNTWTQKANFGGGGRTAIAGFAIGNLGYAGTGENSSGNPTNDFWEYDPSANTWTQRQNVPGSPRRGAMAVSLNGKGYFGTGNNPSPLNDWYEYDPNTNLWATKGNFVGGRYLATCFAVGNKIYGGLGTVGGGSNYADLYEYDPQSGNWNATPLAFFPGTPRYGATGLSLGNSGYVGCGSDASNSNTDFYEYRPWNNTWVARHFVPGNGRYAAFGFSIGNNLYLGSGASSSGTEVDFYKYTPKDSVVASFTTLQAGQALTFTNTSVNAQTYSWTFGDGSSSTAANPSHTYAYGGVYQVCLTATGFCNSSVACQTYTVACSTPTATFTSGVNFNTVNFNTTTTASSYYWNFGDGYSSVQQNPQHIYFGPGGPFTVTLTATNGCGSSTYTAVVNVGCTSPSANFTPVINGSSVLFNNTSTQNANNSWDFNDPASGTFSVSTQPSPTHVFSAAGTYNVSLAVQNACGTNTVVIPVTVSCAPPAAHVVTTQNGMSFLFDGLTSTGATGYKWVFGDGVTSTNPISATHTYSTATTFTAMLKVTNSCGADSTYLVVTPCPLPVASNFTLSASSTTVTASSTAGTSYIWYWNDGNSTPTTSGSTTHTYSATGSHTVCLRATNGCGTDSACQNITLYCGTNMNPQICMISSDSIVYQDSTRYNIIFWDKTLYGKIDSFIVYREVTTNNYTRIGAVSKNALSYFIDSARNIGPANGNPNIGAYRYKLQLRDSCGLYSALSPYHNNVYFIDNHTGTFQFNTYLIENQSTPVSTFDLMRDDNNTGVWTYVGSVTGVQTAINDPNYSTYVSQANWRVEANGLSCTPTMLTGNNSSQGAIVKSRSNVKNNRTMDQSKVGTQQLCVLPNPANDEVVVMFSKNCDNCQVIIVNALGETVKNIFASGRENKINTSDLATGVYFVKVRNGSGAFSQKLIIQH